MILLYLIISNESFTNESTRIVFRADIYRFVTYIKTHPKILANVRLY